MEQLIVSLFDLTKLISNSERSHTENQIRMGIVIEINSDSPSTGTRNGKTKATVPSSTSIESWSGRNGSIAHFSIERHAIRHGDEDARIGYRHSTWRQH